MSFAEQSCVGCGSLYLSHDTMEGQSLYCTSSCQDNHSIFLEKRPEITNELKLID